MNAKTLLVIILTTFYFASCNTKKTDKGIPVVETEKKIPDPGKKNAAGTEKPVKPEPETKPEKKIRKRKPGLLFLEDLVGKYPSKDQIFKDKYFSARLKKIKGLHYELMMQNWNDETSLTREESVLHSSGCMKGNCAGGAYELFIDLKQNNINIYYFNANSMRVYNEKGWIKLPPGFKKELQIKQDLAKIGNTSGDMKSEYRLRIK